LADEMSGSERPPRPVAVWVGGTIAYGALVLALGLVVTGINPEAAVFPPLLTALAGLFVATAINVRPGRLDGEEGDWNRFQTHVIVVAITSMVLSVGLVMCAIAFPGELIARLAFWGAAIAILIGASFLLATVWERLNEPASAPAEPKPKPKPKPEPVAPPVPEPEPEPEPKPASAPRPGPEPKLVAQVLKETKKSKSKSGKKKSKKKDSKKKS